MILTMEESIRRNYLDLEHLEELMSKMWRHIRGKPGIKTRKTELVLNAFAGYCYAYNEKGHKATHCPNKELKKAITGGTGRHFNGNCDRCGH